MFSIYINEVRTRPRTWIEQLGYVDVVGRGGLGVILGAKEVGGMVSHAYLPRSKLD